MPEHDLDEPASEAERAERSVAWAMLCDGLVPGLGHWYLGSPARALVVAAVFIGVIPIACCVLVALDRGYAAAAWVVLAGPWLVRPLAATYAGVVATRATAVEPSPYQTTGAYLLFVVLVLGLARFGAHQVREHVLELATVPADSGLPNIAAGDRIVVSKPRARDRAAERGDLITFVVPGESAVFVKRVVALPGESVAMVGGLVSIDGVVFRSSACEQQDELALAARATCLVEHTPEGGSHAIQLAEVRGADLAPTVVPEGHVWVLGDNRWQSHDSRAFGPLPVSAVEGRVRSVWRR